MKKSMLFPLSTVLVASLIIGGASPVLAQSENIIKPFNQENDTVNSAYVPINEDCTLNTIGTFIEDTYTAWLSNIQNESETLLSKVNTVEDYKNNREEIEGFYRRVTDELELMGITLREYALYYAELLLESDYNSSEKIESMNTFFSDLCETIVYSVGEEVHGCVDNFHTTLLSGPLNKDAQIESPEEQEHELLDETAHYFFTYDYIDYLTNEVNIEISIFANKTAASFDTYDSNYEMPQMHMNDFKLEISADRIRYGLPADSERYIRIQEDIDALLTALDEKDAEVAEQNLQNPYTDDSLQYYNDTSASIRNELNNSWVGSFTLSQATKRFEGAVANLKPLSSYESYSYKELARYPEKYEGEIVSLTGKVLKVIEEGELNFILVAAEENDNNAMIVAYGSNLVDFRVLAGDVLTIYGTYHGLYTPEEKIEGFSSLPAVSADEITLHE